jgi:hypothetical protein
VLISPKKLIKEQLPKGNATIQKLNGPVNDELPADYESEKDYNNLDGFLFEIDFES